MMCEQACWNLQKKLLKPSPFSHSNHINDPVIVTHTFLAVFHSYQSMSR